MFSNMAPATLLPNTPSSSRSLLFRRDMRQIVRHAPFPVVSWQEQHNVVLAMDRGPVPAFAVMLHQHPHAGERRT
jgi:hypothetical protein